MSEKRKIAVVVVDRANYGRLKPVMLELRNSELIDLQVICSGTMVLERFGLAMNILKEDGFKIDSEVFIELEGSTPTTMAKSLGFAVIEFSSEFQRLKPDMVLIIGDRYEALAATISASYMNICIAHIQGGEVSGSIDESARHCITKLAHYHFPSTKRSAQYIVNMGEDPKTVFQVGCPTGDIALNLSEYGLPNNYFESFGTGCSVNPNKPYFLVVFHPVTTAFGAERNETKTLIKALEGFKVPTVWLWPNIDAGSDKISKELRSYTQTDTQKWIRFVKNFTPQDYLKVMANATVAIGNSSSFVRDSSFLGTPVVLIGDRQKGREYSENVTNVPLSEDEIRTTVQKKLQHGKYPVSSLYGNGSASVNIKKILEDVPLYKQKHLHFAMQ